MASNGTENVSIASLSKQISALSSQISSYLAADAQPEPSFNDFADNVPSTPEYESLRASLNDAALDLLRLVNGPKNTLRSMFFSHYDLASLQVALERKFFYHIPLPSDTNGETIENGNHIGTSAAEIAEKAGIDEDRTTRILRMLATHRIFEEVGSETGIFKHTASSALIASDKDFYALANMKLDDMFKASSEASAMFDYLPYVSDTKPSYENSHFYTRFGESVYGYYEKNPKKGARFAQAMSAWSQLHRQISELQETFPWESLKDGKVVDIGGGSGHISIGLARRFPSLNFVVQDVSNVMLSHTQEEALKDLEGRVTFQQHDFFNPQPIHDADAFLIRQCLHNYNDYDCIKILRAVVPALEKCKPGTPLLINDPILPDSGTSTRHEEHHLRQLDLTMMIVLGAKQRSETQFKTLLKEADPRFEVIRVNKNGTGVGLVEVHLNTS